MCNLFPTWIECFHKNYIKLVILEWLISHNVFGHCFTLAHFTWFSEQLLPPGCIICVNALWNAHWQARLGLLKMNLKGDGRKERICVPESTLGTLIPSRYSGLTLKALPPLPVLLSCLWPLAYRVLHNAVQASVMSTATWRFCDEGTWVFEMNPLHLQHKMDWDDAFILHFIQELCSTWPTITGWLNSYKNFPLEVTLSLFIFLKAKSEIWVSLKSRGDSAEIFAETLWGCITTNILYTWWSSNGDGDLLARR